MLTRLLVKLWAVNDDLPQITSPDVIVPICYGMARRDRLAIATRLNFERAIRSVAMFPNAVLAFGNCSYVFPGSEEAESELKRELLAEFPPHRVIEVALNNSVEEAENIRDTLKARGIEPKRILIFTGEMHSRSARLIWRKVFPDAKILVSCADCRHEVERGHLIRVQRTITKFAFANMARHFLLRTVGLSIRRFHHRTAYEK